ncbi:MAG: hypothetical protein J1F36_03075 [Clostridiales bacterium]|nr:hypothetical protein [Clostridiales bacterium]
MTDSVHEGHRARLREAAEKDPELMSFSEFQTLEYLLSFVIPRKDTNPIAHDLIREFGTLNGVLRATKQELYDVPNMTENAAALLSCFYAIVRKSELSRQKPKPLVSNVQEAVNILSPYFIGRSEERSYCMALDINDRVLLVAPISEGLVDFTTLSNNRVVSIVTRTKAKKIIIAHNHPGGSLQPSQQDIKATKSLFMILQTINAVLSDHIIFTDDGHFSFYENGWLDNLLLMSDAIYGTKTSDELQTRRQKGIYMFERKESENNK